jgi:hypothetical protein
MAILFTRTAVVPAWIVVLGLVALLQAPLTVGTSLLVLVVGGLVVPVIMIALWKDGPSSRARAAASRVQAHHARNPAETRW